MNNARQTARRLTRRSLLGQVAIGTMALPAHRAWAAAPLAVPAGSRRMLQEAAATAASGTPVSVGGLTGTPLGKQLAWTIELLNSGGSLPADLETHVAPALLTVLPKEQLPGFMQQVQQGLGSLEMQGLVRVPTGTQAVALVAGSKGVQAAVPIAIEAEPPHRITGVNVYPVPTADGAPLAPLDPEHADPDRVDGLVDIGGRGLYLSRRGTEGPTVVLDAGLGDPAAGWAAIEAAVAGFGRVCSYDRANVFAGASDPAPTPRTTKDMVADLHALLAHADVPEPYVLVGHSLAGMAARLYASRHPEQVAGLVLVDATHEDQFARLAAVLTPEQRAFMEQTVSANPEGIDVLASCAEMKQARTEAPLQPMPLVVLTAGQPPDPTQLPPGWPADEEARIHLALQDDLASLVPGARHIVAERSGHYIHQSQPDLVVEAIRAVVAAVRDPATWATPAAVTHAAT